MENRSSSPGRASCPAGHSEYVRTGSKDGVGGGDGIEGQIKSFPGITGRVRRLELTSEVKDHFI